METDEFFDVDDNTDRPALKRPSNIAGLIFLIEVDAHIALQVEVLQRSTGRKGRARN